MKNKTYLWIIGILGCAASVWALWLLLSPLGEHDERLFNSAAALATSILISLNLASKKLKGVKAISPVIAMPVWVCLIAFFLWLLKQIIPIDLDPESFKWLRIGLLLAGLLIILICFFLRTKEK